MINVIADSVRDRLNLTENDVTDEKVIEMIKDATAAIEVETGLNIDYTNCSDYNADSSRCIVLAKTLARQS